MKNNKGQVPESLVNKKVEKLFEKQSSDKNCNNVDWGTGMCGSVNYNTSPFDLSVRIINAIQNEFRESVKSDMMQVADSSTKLKVIQKLSARRRRKLSQLN